jgi:hypothetical protein
MVPSAGGIGVGFRMKVNSPHDTLIAKTKNLRRFK